VSTEPGIGRLRFGRILVLISVVTAVFLVLSADRLGGQTFQIGAFAIGTVAVITAIIGFLIAAGSAVDV
jgi:hypothetical protein